MQKKKNISVMGAGYWGKNLVRVFYKLGVLQSVFDTDQKIIKDMKSTYPGLQCPNDEDELFNDSGIDGVVIATPAVTHYQKAKKALSSNKHVFVEKPLALTVPEGAELVRLAHERNRLIMVGHILQYHTAVLRLKELIDQGALGKIQYIYSNRLNIGKIRSEENILWSFAPHDISIILMLLNEFPLSVYTAGGSYLQNNVVDVTMSNLDFSSGVKAHVFVSWLHPYKEQKLIVVGDKKMAVFDDLSKEKLFLYPHKVEWIDRMPVASRADAEIVDVKIEEPLLNECRHFLNCIEKDLTPKTDGEEGLRVLRVLDMSQKSLNSRDTIYTDAKERRDQKAFFVHESSFIDEDVAIGEGTQIWHFSHVLKKSSIGKKCKIGQNVVIGPEVTIGNNCKIQNNVSIYKGVTLEDDVFCGPSMVFTNVFNPRSAIPRMDELRETLVKTGASIGANATILCGVRIGKHAFIGAGAVVTKDVSDYALMYGNPASIKGWMCACGSKLDFEDSQKTTCTQCGTAYTLHDNQTITANIKKSRSTT